MKTNFISAFDTLARITVDHGLKTGAFDPGAIDLYGSLRKPSDIIERYVDGMLMCSQFEGWSAGVCLFVSVLMPNTSMTLPLRYSVGSTRQMGAIAMMGKVTRTPRLHDPRLMIERCSSQMRYCHPSAKTALMAIAGREAELAGPSYIDMPLAA